MPLIRVLVLFALLFVAAAPCLAQSGAEAAGEDEATPDEERKQYRVEVIVFEQLGPGSAAGEEFDRLVVSDYFPSGSFDIDEYNRFNELVSYADMKHLAGALQRLDGDGQYRIMERLAWTQPLLSEAEAVDVGLGRDAAAPVSPLEDTAGGQGAGRLAGTVRVFGDYLLFVELNLKAWLERRPERVREAGAGAPAGSGGFTPIVGSGAARTPQATRELETYYMDERRRIKLEEYHYFDHPYFGAIVTVWRHEDDNPSR